ncbi:hypothetical protein AHiyo8_pI68770 (plasmid) [Arthrobacter sp. Hiyo8]|nr:hypothetical protein AHiyo8_pI68770 [Arthrobacter sp. Hiyo8]
MKFIKGFFEFWYDFIIGDDWKIAVSVLIPLVVGAGFVLNGFEASLLLPRSWPSRWRHPSSWPWPST